MIPGSRRQPDNRISQDCRDSDYEPQMPPTFSAPGLGIFRGTAAWVPASGSVWRTPSLEPLPCSPRVSFILGGCACPWPPPAAQRPLWKDLLLPDSPRKRLQPSSDRPAVTTGPPLAVTVLRCVASSLAGLSLSLPIPLAMPHAGRWCALPLPFPSTISFCPGISQPWVKPSGNCEPNNPLPLILRVLGTLYQ